MTTTINTPDTTSTDTGFEGLVHVDPRTLTLEDNVRTIKPAEQVKINGFTVTAREVGIYTPLTGVRDELGQIMIRDGQCRLIAALAAEVATVPVLIRRDDRTGDAREIGRRTEQLLANSAIPMREDDVTATIDQLAAFGVPVEKIALRANLDHERVAATVATTGRDGVRSKVVEYALNLEQVNAMIEFEDNEDDLDRLARAAQDGEFEHTVQTIRQERADAAARAAFEQPFRDRGIGILTRYPYYGDTTPDGAELHRLHGLINPDGQDATHADIAAERLWIYLSETETYYVRETGVEVADHEVEWDYDPEYIDDDGQPWQLEDGEHDPATIETRVEWRIEVALTTDPAADGLTKRPTNLPATAGDDTDPEGTAAQLAAAKEQQRHERRRLIALNKAGASAEVVRREYVSKLLTRKTPPKGAAKLTAHVINAGVFYKQISDGAAIARELLGADNVIGRNTIEAMIDKASEQRAQVISLAYALGTFEQLYTKSSWRDDVKHIKPYLDFLITTGYTPATVETVITGERTPDEAFTLITDAATAPVDAEPDNEDQQDNAA